VSARDRVAVPHVTLAASGARKIPSREVAGRPVRATVARRAALAGERKLARDYAADRSDIAQLARDLEGAQLELMHLEDE